jgi:hypothetical protein
MSNAVAVYCRPSTVKQCAVLRPINASYVAAVSMAFVPAHGFVSRAMFILLRLAWTWNAAAAAGALLWCSVWILQDCELQRRMSSLLSVGLMPTRP